MTPERKKDLLPTTHHAVVGQSPKSAEDTTNNGKVSMGSIGRVSWDEANDRWKGLLCACHADASSISKFLLGILHECHGGSRITVRIFTTRDADVAQISRVTMPWEENALLTAEAIIPINKGDIGSLIYFGANLPERISPAHTMFQEWKLLSNCLNSLT